MIPEKLLNLNYTSHAIRERCFEEKGTIEYAPKNFIRAGCKAVVEDPKTKDVIKVTYIYDDTRDIVLVINAVTKSVITNYLKFAKNKGVFKGRFRLATS